MKSSSSGKIIIKLIEGIQEDSEISGDKFKSILSRIQKDTGIKGKTLYQPIRLALTGEEHGPDLGLIANVLGKEEILKRLNKYFGLS